MFRALCLLGVVLFSSAAFAQFTITQVVHNPTKSEVGPVIAALPADIPPPAPIPPAGVAPNNAYGDGKTYHNELPRVSAEFYAMSGTTTHELAYLRNGSGADINITTSTIGISSRPAKDVSAKPEQADPGILAAFIHGTAASVTIPAGSELALFLWVVKWRVGLDTSPRDYDLTITMTDTVSGSQITATARLTVPKVGGTEGSGCVSSGDGSPAALLLLALGGMAAIVPRLPRWRRLRAKA